MNKETEILKYSNPNKVVKKMKQLGFKEQLFISTRKDKKYMIIHDGKKIHFGLMGYEDYTKSNSLDKRNKFRSRNKKWADYPKYSPAYLSYYLLW